MFLCFKKYVKLTTKGKLFLNCTYKVITVYFKTSSTKVIVLLRPS